MKIIYKFYCEIKREWYKPTPTQLAVTCSKQCVKSIQNSGVSIVDFEQENAGWIQVSRKVRKIKNGIPYDLTHRTIKVSKNWVTTDKIEISYSCMQNIKTIISFI